ncbi:MAG: hypothetical protein GY832_15325 [Chloroflexi bacterium]|nr:hypothetical protein [Chloroflexota bacterium]
MPNTKRATASGVSLTCEDVSLVKGMIDRGDRQHDIAAFFDVNGGRVGEIASGDKFTDVHAADEAFLPPAGPYLSGRQSALAMKALTEARDALDIALGTINKLNGVT